MISFIRRIIRACVAPKQRLICHRSLWKRTLTELQERGGGRRESGAFLLGRRDGRVRRIIDLAFYDELDPTALEAGHVHLHRRAYTALWERCDALGLEVVADVHTHPGKAFLSEADRTHPTIPQAGHIAVIIPNYAKVPFDRSSFKRYGIYEYLGDGKWQNHSGSLARQFFFVGIWG